MPNIIEFDFVWIYNRISWWGMSRPQGVRRQYNKNTRRSLVTHKSNTIKH